MASLPYRYQEILTALRDNPKGLTTGQIFNICCKQRGSELFDSTITGQCIYALRNNGTPKITSSDAVGGKVHKITPHGLQLLADALRDEPVALAYKNPNPLPDESPAKSERVAQNPPEAAPIAPLEPNDPGDEKAAMPDIGPDLLASFDEATLIMRKCILDTLINAEIPFKIRDKSRKLSALERLEQIVSDDIAELLAAIRADLELLEAE